eukprot:m.268493 g.268493  ORF g.268493 m.268493 type:complete len:189 (+) comp11077_c3_seq7:1699-2265(+)
MKGAKHVLRYLRRNMHCPLSFKIGCTPRIEAYCDASFASEANSRSITGYILMVQGAAVAWASKTQSTVAMSTCEAEYIALAELTRDIKFVRNILEALGFPQPTTLVYEDNAACIALAQQREVSKRSKHINLSYHATRLLVDQNIIKLIHCRSNEQLADSFTKIAIPAPRFQEHRDIYCGGAATSRASV